MRWVSAPPRTPRTRTRCAALEREFPYLTAWLRRHRHHRSAASGLATTARSFSGCAREPYLAVRRPEHHDHTITMQSPWAWSDSVSSWTWPGFEGQPVTVEVYADADEVALLLDGAEVAGGPVGGTKPMLAVLETGYHPGQLVAVAYRDGGRGRPNIADYSVRRRVARRLRRPRASSAPTTATSRSSRSNCGTPTARLVTGADRPVTVEVSGAGCWPGCAARTPRRPSGSTPPLGRPSTAARSPSSGPPGWVTSPSP